MGAFLDKPKTEKHSESGCGNGLSYGLSSMQGWRIEMEDAHCALVGLSPHLTDWSFFAVFDGHAGARVSAHCADHLLDTIIQSGDVFRDCSSNGCPTAQEVESGIKEGFLRLDERMRKIPEIASGEDKSGSTAVCCLVSATHFYFANCGDSRAVLSRDRRAFFVTEDHKPVNPAEKERIQRAGGSVMVQRVNGSLAVSRALGDYEYKQVEGKGPCEQLVSPEPQVDVVARDGERDEFLILACDGVWDVMGNKEICDNTRYMMQITSDLEHICNCIIDACFGKGSKDNMSVVLVALPGAPTLNEEIIQQDKELNNWIEKKVKEIVSSNENIEICEIMHMLDKDEHIQNPGIVYYKYSLIEEMFNKLENSSSNKEEEEQEAAPLQDVTTSVSQN